MGDDCCSARKYPDLKGCAANLCEFVEAWSGGSAGPLLSEVDEFNKTLSVKRTLPPETLGTLKQLRMAAFPEWISALVKTMLSAPEGMHNHGVASVISTSDVQAMQTTKRDACIAAVTDMRKGGRWLETIDDLDAAYRVKAYSELQINLVMFVLGKKSRFRTFFASFEALRKHFISHVQDVSKNPLAGDLPWTEAELATTEGDGSQRKSARSVREFTGRGLSVETLLTRGFVVGAGLVSNDAIASAEAP